MTNRLYVAKMSMFASTKIEKIQRLQSWISQVWEANEESIFFFLLKNLHDKMDKEDQ